MFFNITKYDPRICWHKELRSIFFRKLCIKNSTFVISFYKILIISATNIITKFFVVSLPNRYNIDSFSWTFIVIDLVSSGSILCSWIFSLSVVTITFWFWSLKSREVKWCSMCLSFTFFWSVNWLSVMSKTERMFDPPQM